jgi:hypothetical protein
VRYTAISGTIRAQSTLTMMYATKDKIVVRGRIVGTATLFALPQVAQILKVGIDACKPRACLLLWFVNLSYAVRTVQ